MADVDADVWVLTETHLDHAPSAEHRHAVFSSPHPERRPAHEGWTALWSRWPLQEISRPASHRGGTVAAVVEHPTDPILVYGTVIAWQRAFYDDGSPGENVAGPPGRDRPSGTGVAAAPREHPDLPLIVAGDFNQDRDGSGWYGTTRTRQPLGEALDTAGLHCVTEMDPGAIGLTSGHLIDHICTTADLADTARVNCWNCYDATGQRLSDHPTVAADLGPPDVVLSLPGTAVTSSMT
ncbi:MAG: hypothetical protein QOI86_5184 [Actinomycetota bacterium]|nr:hypothetical protein [Actinomycetota bacterium]